MFDRHRGTTLLDQRYTPLLDHPSEMNANPAAIEEASLPVLDALLGRLATAGGRGASEDDDYAVVSAVAEGLAKLLLHQQLPGAHHAPLQDAETHKACLCFPAVSCFELIQSEQENSLRLIQGADKMETSAIRCTACDFVHGVKIQT